MLPPLLFPSALLDHRNGLLHDLDRVVSAESHHDQDVSKWCVRPRQKKDTNRILPAFSREDLNYLFEEMLGDPAS
jgi:hypothetical protein